MIKALARRMLRPILAGRSLPVAVVSMLSDRTVAADAGVPTRSAYYFKFGKWLVRPRYLAWFLWRYPGDAPPFRLPVEYVKLDSVPEAVVERYPIVCVKPSTSKLSLFDVESGLKKCVWSDPMRYREAMAASDYFSHPPSVTPPILARDSDLLSMEEPLIGPLFGATDTELADALPILVGLNASCRNEAHSLADYVSDHAPYVRDVGRRLEPTARGHLREAFETLKAIAEADPSRPVLVTRAHNDVQTHNMVRGGGRVYLIDLDQSFRATAWYDLVFLASLPEGISRSRVFRSIRSLNERLGYDDESGPANAFEFYFLLFVADYCRYVATRWPMPEESDSASAPRYRLHLLSQNLAGETWNEFAKGAGLVSAAAEGAQAA
jgi:hypothetical protein